MCYGVPATHGICERLSVGHSVQSDNQEVLLVGSTWGMSRRAVAGYELEPFKAARKVMTRCFNLTDLPFRLRAGSAVDVVHGDIGSPDGWRTIFSLLRTARPGVGMLKGWGMAHLTYLYVVAQHNCTKPGQAEQLTQLLAQGSIDNCWQPGSTAC